MLKTDVTTQTTYYKEVEGRRIVCGVVAHIQTHVYG